MSFFIGYVGVYDMKLKLENMDCGMNYVKMYGDMLKGKWYVYVYVL